MNNKIVFLIALMFASLFAIIPMHSALGDDINSTYVYLNGHYVDQNIDFSVERGSTLGIKVFFTAGSDINDVRAKAWIDGYRTSIEDQTERFDILAGRTYSKYLYLKVPNDIDDGTYTLHVLITSKQALTGINSQELTLTVQKQSYKVDVLAVNLALPSEVNAGNKLTAEVVVKNMGNHKINDVFVEASIPELGLSRKIYAGDLYSYDNSYESDTKKLLVSFTIPETAETGTYSLKVNAYDEDVKAEATQYFNVIGKQAKEETELVAQDANLEAKAGKTVNYKLIVANLGTETKTYTVEIEGLKGWANYNVEPKVFVLSKDQSKEINLKVSVNNNAIEANHIFSVKLKENDNVVKTLNLGLDVTTTNTETAQFSLWIAVILLAIVVIVLAIVLATTAKTKKEVKSEEVYY